MSQFVAKFVSDLMVHFPFKHETPERETAWITSMARELRGYDHWVLEKASKQIIATRTDRRFPLPAECREACENAQKELEIVERAANLQFDPRFTTYDHTTERLQLANDMACNPSDPICRQAAKEGWIGALQGFCRKWGEMPSAKKQILYRSIKCLKGKEPPIYVDEIEFCKREAKDFDEAYRATVKGGWEQAKSLERMGAKMLEERRRLADRVLRGHQ